MPTRVLRYQQMKMYLLLFIFLVGIFLTHFFISGQAIYGDGIDYWAYLHTWYIDHDLNFTNEFQHQYSPEYNNAHPEYLSPEVQKTHINSTGTTDDVHSQGMAVMVFPFFVTADWIARIANALGAHILRNGYSDVYQISVGIGATLYVVSGAWCTQQICTKIFSSKKTGNRAVLAVVLCSPLLYYGGYDVINSHPISFFLTASFWYVLLCRSWSHKNSMLLGLLLGLAGMNRYQDVLLFFPFLAFLFHQKIPNKFPHVALVTAIAFLVNLPMIYTWYVLYTFPLPLAYLGARRFQGISGVFFHQTNGIFSRTPLMVLSIVGAWLLSKQKEHQFMVMIMGAYVLSNLALIILQGGWRDAAYGGRMFISLLPVFAVLIAAVFARMGNTRFAQVPAVLIAIFFLLNVMSIGHFVLFEKQAITVENKMGLEKQTQERLDILWKNLH